MSFNEAKKIAQARREMYIAVNQMRRDMKREAIAHFQKSFDNEGFTEKSFWHWTPRKRVRGRVDDGHKILTKTGKLRNSIKTFVNSTKEYFTLRFSSNLPYAKIHNEGLTGLAWGKRVFKMAKRMFMGYSTVLDRKLTNLFDRRIKRIFNK